MYPNKYYITILLFIFMCNVKSQLINPSVSLQSPSVNKSVLPATMTEIYNDQLYKKTGTRIFVETFVQIVTKSKQLNQIFNLALSTDEIIEVYFQAFSESLAKAGVEDPPAVAKTVSNGLRHTYLQMSENVIIYAAANAISLYFLTEGVFVNLEALHAVAFAGAILQNYPVNDHPGPLDLVRALSYGINDFLLPFNIYTPSRLPVVPISFAKQCYAMTDVAAPITSEKEIFSLSVNTALGIKRFTGNFLKELSASPVLKSAFNFTGSVARVSKVWNDVIRIECARLKSLQANAISNRFSRALSATFESKSPTGYAIDFACGYGIYVMSQGYLTHSTLLTLPKELASAIETALLPNADLFAKISAIVNTYKILSNNHTELKYSDMQFSAIIYYTGSELYASTKKQRPLSDSAGV